MPHAAKLVAFALMLTAGCSFGSVHRVPDATPSYVVAEGTTRYALDGAESMVADRRRSAHQEMSAACRGAYEVVRETDEHEPTVANAPLATPSALIAYRSIDYRCVPSPRPDPNRVDRGR